MKSTVVVFFRGARSSAVCEPSRIKQVLWTELAEGPAKPWAELYAQKVTHLTIDAIANAALQLSFRIPDMQSGLERNRLINLNARAGNGDIFQIRNRATQLSALILPLDIDEVRAQHTVALPVDYAYILAIGLEPASRYTEDQAKAS